MSDQQFNFGFPGESKEVSGDMSAKTSTGSKQNACPGSYKGLSIATYLTGSESDPHEVSYNQLTANEKAYLREENERLSRFKSFREYREAKFESKHGFPLSWKEHEIRPIIYRRRGEITYTMEKSPHMTVLRKKEYYPDKKHGGGNRGNVTDYSWKSRKRFYERLLCIDWNEIPEANICFATLTYPDQYPKDGIEIKRELDVLSKRMMRFGKTHYGDLSFVWKLEFQKRGAPHYHFIIVTERPIILHDFRSWLSEAWADIVKKWMESENIEPELIESEHQKHLKAGTEADPVKKNKVGMISYLALYVGGKTKKKAKEYQHHLPEEYSNVGRWWGIYGKSLKKKTTKITSLTEQEYYSMIFEFQEYWERNQLPSYIRNTGKIVKYSF
ncbi:MAG: hypothetical protein PQJ50_12505 [Spirochaetales bacterium]|nr:hypothetical protein [Spirochaetales bacterium]